MSTKKQQKRAQQPKPATAPSQKLLAYPPQLVQALRATLGRRPHDDVANLCAGLQQGGVMVTVSPADGVPPQERIAYAPGFVQAVLGYINLMPLGEVRGLAEALEQGGVPVDPPAANAPPETPTKA